MSRGLRVPSRHSLTHRPSLIPTRIVAKYYKSPSTFTCISNPSITIPFSRVNDDFCDCPDGSDEPGTAACSYLSTLSPPHYAPGTSVISSNLNLSLPGFYCKNKGHLPAYLRFESVNDGRCDYDVCCDGSDEYAAVGGKKCPSKCAEIGKEYRKQEEVRNKALRNAMKKRKEYVTRATALRAEVATKVKGLQVQVETEEKKIAEATESLKEVERKERSRVVRSGSSGKTKGKTGVLLGLAKARVEELRGALEKTKKHRDSMLDRVGELEAVLSAMKEERNPNFNDEGVKRAVQAWEDYAARETDDHWTEAEDRDLDVIMKEDGEGNGVNWAEFEDAEEVENDVASLYQFINYLPPGMQAWLMEKIASVKQLLVDNGVLATPGAVTDVADSKAVQDAKKTLADAERGLNNARSELANTENDLNKDYGPEGVFRALKDKCISKDSGEYTYEVCFMSSTKQVSKKNGGNTGMGNFNSFEVEVVDEAIPADGKGPGKGERVVMKYENGQSCWNGPNRSTRVILGCSENEEIWKVTETEKCVYRMEVGTPAVCGFGNELKQTGGESKKDEL